LNTYEFEQAKNNLKYPTLDEFIFHANPYHQNHFINSYDPFQSSISPILCEYCDSSGHDTCNCPYCDYVDATYASVEKKLYELTDKMIENMKVRIAEYSQCFNQSRANCNESNSSLGSLKPEVSLYDDFEPSYLTRS